MRNEIIKINDDKFISIRYNDLATYSKIKRMYSIIENNPYIPKMKFDGESIIMPNCGPTLNEIRGDSETKETVKRQIINFIKLMFENKVAHRDLHIKNICWDGEQIWVIDWEFITNCDVKKISEHYDVCGEGLPSPLSSENMCILKNHKYSVSNWLKPIKIDLDE